MISNATLSLIEYPPTPDGRGGQTAGALVSLSIDCCLDEVTRAQRISLEARIAAATAVAYVPIPVTNDIQFKQRMRLGFTQDSIELPRMEVVEVIKRIHDLGESHWQVFLKAS